MQLAQLILSGLAQGCIYGLIALGFVLIYKATETINFAQGELMMLGAFIGLACMTVLGLPFWASIIVTMLAMVTVGVILEWALIRPLLGQMAFTVVMVTIGFGYIARGAITMIPGWGTDTHALPVPYKGELVRVAGGQLVISVEQLVIIGATAALCLALYLFFRFSKYGIAMQAVSQNQLAAYYMGIPVRGLNTAVWGLSAAIAAIGGILLAPITFVHANMGFIGMKAFPAAIIGGFGSIPGAIVGGLIIGVIEALAGYYLPEGFKDVAPYIAVLIMLIVRPRGLFGEKMAKRA